MKILFQDQTVEFEHSPTVQDVIEKINEFLQENFYYSYLIADGKEVLEDPELYLTENISNISSIEIFAVGAREFINDLLLSSEEYTHRAIPHITRLVNDFYNNPSPINWRELGELLEGMQWILTMIKTIDQSKFRPSIWNEILTNADKLFQELEQLEEALKNRDTILIADIINYEILPIFQSFALHIKTAIDTEGRRNDIC